MYIQDSRLGFVNNDILSEPINYESHFFYKDDTEVIIIHNGIKELSMRCDDFIPIFC